MNEIVQGQIYFLRLLSKYDSEIQVSLDGRSAWIPLFYIVQNSPINPIGHRSILKNELVFEIDDDDWSVVRDGTNNIIDLLNEWGAEGSYYLSFSGNRSIHVHAFFDIKGIELQEETSKLLENADTDEIHKELKAYVMRQTQYATGTSIDVQLSGKHLIRLEGSINEKSRKPCSMIHEIPDNRPENYETVIPEALPPKKWDLKFMEDEINVFFQIHFRPLKLINYGSAMPIENPEKLIDILRPAYNKGYRHHLVSALSGFLWRHKVPIETAVKIIKDLGSKDDELSSRIYTLREIYKADKSKKIPGLPKLLSIIKEETDKGFISKDTADEIDNKLREVLL